MSKNTSIAWRAFQPVHRRPGGARPLRQCQRVVRAGLRLLEEQEVRLEGAARALAEGEDSGAAEPFDSKAFLADMHGRHAGRP